jgi:hypothetical protein
MGLALGDAQQTRYHPMTALAEAEIREPAPLYEGDLFDDEALRRPFDHYRANGAKLGRH